MSHFFDFGVHVPFEFCIRLLLHSPESLALCYFLEECGVGVTEGMGTFVDHDGGKLGFPFHMVWVKVEVLDVHAGE